MPNQRMKPSGNGGRPQTELNVTGAISAGLSWSLPPDHIPPLPREGNPFHMATHPVFSRKDRVLFVPNERR